MDENDQQILDDLGKRLPRRDAKQLDKLTDTERQTLFQDSAAAGAFAAAKADLVEWLRHEGIKEKALGGGSFQTPGHHVGYDDAGEVVHYTTRQAHDDINMQAMGYEWANRIPHPEATAYEAALRSGLATSEDLLLEARQRYENRLGELTPVVAGAARDIVRGRNSGVAAAANLGGGPAAGQASSSTGHHDLRNLARTVFKR
ncbi:hypothetical protein [Micromonospora yangpuensis]|uniref:Uncharacterized protein n=1 Tax=Micromonospora yangpuensis TaxID=683228 RepID=A0A1C6U0U9_9ACTN|nr:hypothetical protein [Micromonospora yangpuensis]GGM11784.1 hypothetical protein GCM10012279_32370 [Micromonospora yangpuensis]SCL47523.1 hypothetical protein GA0070617_0607 [Micromonospora yangpuensis]